NRTRSWMALRTPYRWSACATTATSPNQDGVLGESVGSTWMWTTGSVIFLSSLSHSFSLRKTHFCRLCQFFRAFSPSSLTRCVSRGLDKMSEDEATAFLLRRSGTVSADSGLQPAHETARHDARQLAPLLDGLPLALDQAG